MAKYTADELNKCSKDSLVAMILSMQDQLDRMNQNLERLIEQFAAATNRKYGRSSEKLDIIDGQLSLELDFNEAEALTDTVYVPEPSEEEVIMVKRHKHQGKRDEDLKDLPVEEKQHVLTDERLNEIFGARGWKRLPDEVYKRVRIEPAVYTVEEHHVAVYAGRDNQTIVKADRPKDLLRNSIATPSLVASIMNAKYVNGLPLHRIGQEFERNGIHISKQVMANWMIQTGDRYLGCIFDWMHEKLMQYHVLQADETPVRVSKDGRPANSMSYMWVYRTGKYYRDTPIVLYDYQKNRNAAAPEAFLKGFNGTVLTDAHSAYRKMGKDKPGIEFAACWAHARRRYSDAVKALKADDKKFAKETVAYEALERIAAIYHLDNELSDLTPAERLEKRKLRVSPLVEDYFAWVKQVSTSGRLAKGYTLEGINYSISNEKYLRLFLEDGEVALDNNATESALRTFCLHKHTWRLIDTIDGAKSSAIIYSITETAKLNGLNPFRYIEFILTELVAHQDETDRSFLEDLMPWSAKLPNICKAKK